MLRENFFSPFLLGPGVEGVDENDENAGREGGTGGRAEAGTL